MRNSNRKNILVIGGHDPSGGAGIQADIESISSAGCRAVSIITTLTTQNSNTVQAMLPQTAEQLKQQLQFLLEDIPVAACKIGLLGDASQVRVIADALSEQALPVVLDPVLRSGSGVELATQDLIQALLHELIPLATVITPNSDEARRLTGCEKLQDAAASLLDKGAGSVLITGTDEDTEEVINQLFPGDGQHHTFRWPRLPHTYHGSGCTLAARLTAELSMQTELVTAVEKAQDYTWHSLEKAEKVGQGQWLPNRFF